MNFIVNKKMLDWLHMKQRLLICFIFALVLSGCGKANITQPNSKVEKKDEKVAQFSDRLSLRELVAKGGSLKCSVKEADVTRKQEVTYYVDGKSQKMRADIKMDIGESGTSKTINSSMIMDKQTVYSWSSEQPGTGMKFTLDLGSTGAKKPADNNNSVDVNSKMDFNCEKWAIDDTLFVLPANIKFTDLSETIKNIQKTIPSPSKKLK